MLTAFTRVGAVCYGGGALSLPALRLWLVERGVLSKQGFEEVLSLAKSVLGFLLSNLAVFSGIRSSGALFAVPAILAAVLSLQPVTLAMLVMMVIRMVPGSLTSRNQDGIAAASGAAMLFFSAHPLVLLSVR